LEKSDKIRQFEAIYQENYRRVFAFALKLSGSKDEAIDITQETFLRAFAGYEKFRHESELSTWLMGITLNLARKLYRRRSRLIYTDKLKEGATERTPEQEAGNTELAGILGQALAKLPKKQRNAVIARSYGEQSFAEIARSAGGSETGARVNYHHGLKRLKIELEKLGVNGI
jgi:RNA polymerase sigma-70 factor, ECF subfamily